MLIGVDLDDVLADYIPALCEFHNATYGTSLARENFHSYSFWEVWGGTKEEARKKAIEFRNSSYFDNIQPVAGSIEGVDVLKKSHNLVIITSRSTIDKTNEWLNKHFPNKFSGVYFSHNHYTGKGTREKSDICLDLGVNAMIEDNLEYSLDCALKSIKVLLFNSPWNNQIYKVPLLKRFLLAKIKRIGSWKEIIEKGIESFFV